MPQHSTTKQVSGAAVSIRRLVMRALSIHPGEAIRAVLAFAYLFLIVSSYLMIKTIRNALFISEFGAMKLPYVMLGIALLAGLFAAGYIRLARRLPTPALTFWSLLFFASNVLTFWWLAQASPRWLYPVIYLWAGVYGVIATTQVWTLANELFTTREAKRVFAFVGAGGVLGGAVGGGLSNRLAGLIGTTNLMLVVVGLLLVAATVVRVVGRYRAVDSDRRRRFEPPKNLADSLRAIRGSRHLTLLAGLVFITALATTSIDFQFNIVAERTVGTSQDKLAAFFGAVYGSVALLSFTLQLLLTSRVMNHFGIGVTILALPLVLVVGSAALLATGSLAAALALKGGDGMLKHSLDRSCREVLYLPVPARIKVNAKSTIDTVLDRMGDGAAGVLQIFITGVLGLGLRASLLTNLVVIGGWLMLTRRLKGEYVNQLRESLRDPRRARPDFAVGAEADTRMILERTLRDGDEEERLAALDWLADNAADVDEKLLLELAQDERHPRVRRAALGVLLAGDDVELPATLLEGLEEEGEAVLVSAFDLVLESGGAGCSPAELEVLLEKAGDTTRLSVVAFVVARLGADFEPFADKVFRALLDPSAPRATRCAAVRALALLPRSMALPRRLSDLLHDDDGEVRAAAAETAGRRGRVDLVPELVGILGRTGSRRAVRRTLQTFGPPAVDALETALQRRSAPAEIRREAPRVLARLCGPRSVEVLGRALDDPDPVVAERSLAGLHRLRADGMRVVRLLGSQRLEWESLRLIERRQRLCEAANALRSVDDDPSLVWLVEAADEQSERLLDRIFTVLAMLGSADDVARCRRALRCGSPLERANAVEYLDNTLPRSLKRPLLPAIETARGSAPPRPGELGLEDALRRLVDWPDPWIAACALHAARYRGMPGFEEIASRAVASADVVLSGEAAAYGQALEGTA